MDANIWIYDIEVFKFDWLIVFHNYKTGQKKIFHNYNYGVAHFIDKEQPLLGGYNVKHYDQWILKAIYHGADNATVKALNDFIIADGMEGWNFPFLNYKTSPCVQFDLMDDIAVFLRLKEIEGNLGMDIQESSIPFDIDRSLNDEQLQETIKYCCHDVDATVRLFEERKNYLQSKILVGEMKGLSIADSLRLTNAKLTAEYLGAKFYDRGDEFEYDFPDNLIIKKYTEVVKFFKKIDPKYKKTSVVEIADVPHTIAWGGLHGAIENYSEQKTETRTVMHIDVTSYYPSLMIVNKYMSRSVPDPDEYERVYRARIEAKKSGDKEKADALKLVLNTTYGAMKNPYNALYDPRMANAVCISGQLYLIDLIEKLEEIPTFKLIQSNTDGLIVSYDNKADEKVKNTVHEWEARTGFKMGFEEIEKIIQKDVNNYILRDTAGKIEVKGGYVSNYTGGDFINKSFVIVAKAVVAKLLDDISVEKTINDCQDIDQFQIICKAGNTYDKVIQKNEDENIEVQTVNSVYATKNKSFGTIYKVKLPKEDQKERWDKIANLPLNCLIDNENTCTIERIDKQFYIEMAQKRINDYLGIKPEKKTRGKKNMATKKDETEVNEVNCRIKLYQKLFDLQTIMDGFEWTKDGINRHQSYEYITEKQYKNNFKAARAQVRLLWKMDEVGHQFVGTISDKMHLILTDYRGRLIDPDTGEFEEYLFSGSGADNGDKALYKAYTGGLKFFIASNYLVAEGNDPESDEDDIKKDKPQFTPPEKREIIKEKITNQDEPATDVQLEAIAEGITMLIEKGLDKEITEGYAELLDTELTKALAEETIDSINTLLSEDAA